jgi:ABC-type lipoprotein release transport system permease subunit
MLNMYRKKKIKGIFSAVRNQQHLHNSDWTTKYSCMKNVLEMAKMVLLVITVKT